MHQINQLSLRSNSLLRLGVSLCLGLLSFGVTPANALPGQTADQVAAWIQSHPTLQPGRGERLQVRKSDTPAHRFIFEALLFSPGQTGTETGNPETGNPETGNPETGNLIRMEQMSFFDRTTGVSQSRLQDALQVIYGSDIYQDYQQASIVYQYPDPVSLNTSQEPDIPLQESLQGEVRQGDRYAYWLEIAPTASGVAYNGRISVLLNEDIAGLVSALQRR